MAMLNIEKQVELAEVVCGKNGRWKVSQAEAASELGGRSPGATGCGGWKRDEGRLYEDGQKRTKWTAVREKSGANSAFPANQIM